MVFWCFDESVVVLGVCNGFDRLLWFYGSFFVWGVLC